MILEHKQAFRPASQLWFMGVLLCAVWSLTARAQEPTWYVAHLFPPAITINGIDCRDSLNCLIAADSVIGGSTQIMKTTDGGLTWRTVWKWGPTYPSVGQLTGVWWVTDSLALATCDSGKLIRSTDGGETWVERVLFDRNARPHNITMANGLNGMLSLDYVAEPRTFITDDGGVNWRPFDVPDPTGYDVTRWVWSSSGPYRLSRWRYVCIKEGRGTFRESRLLLTSDGGATWDTTRTPFPGWEAHSPWSFRMVYGDSTLGWAITRITVTDSTPDWRWLISRTTDGGWTWKVMFADTLYYRHGIPVILWPGDTSRLMISSFYMVARTIDACRSWTFDSSQVPHDNPIGTPPHGNTSWPVYGIPGFNRHRFLRYGIPPSSEVTPAVPIVHGPQRRDARLDLLDATVQDGALRIRLRTSTSSTVTVRLFDSHGATVQTYGRDNANDGMSIIQLDVSALPVGVYIVQVESDGETDHRMVGIVR